VYKIVSTLCCSVCVCVLQDVMKWLIVKTWHLWSSRLITWLIATELPSTSSRDSTDRRLRWSPPCVGELPSTSSRDTTIHRRSCSPPCVGDLPSTMSCDTKIICTKMTSSQHRLHRVTSLGVWGGRLWLWIIEIPVHIRSMTTTVHSVHRRSLGVLDPPLVDHESTVQTSVG